MEQIHKESTERSFQSTYNMAFVHRSCSSNVTISNLNQLRGVSASLVRWLSLFEFASLFECNKYVNFSTTKLLSTMMCDVKEFPGNLLLSPFEL